MKSKDQAFSAFKHYLSFSERDTGSKLRRLRSDNRGEYVTKDWQNYCDSSGISHSMGSPHSPQLNGTAERYNRTLLDRLLLSLFHANLPSRFWEAAARHAIASINLSASRVNPGKSSPHSLWKNTPALDKYLRSFGCKCSRLVTGPTRGGKLSKKGSNCLLLRTLPDGDGWLVWGLSLSKEVKYHDVVFYEDCVPGLGAPSKKTLTELFSWSEGHSRSGSSAHQRWSRDLWERRLSASIHNPARHNTYTALQCQQPRIFPTRRGQQ